MRNLILFFIISIFNFSLSAQDGWINVLNSSAGNFSDVVFSSQSKGFVANELGTILLTTEDEGTSWDGLAFPFWQTFGFFFIDSTNGWASDYNIFAKTTDGGENWVTIYSDPDMFFIEEIYFTTPLNGYLTGREHISDPFGDEFIFIIRSTDGGSSWNYVYQDTITTAPKEFSSIYFVNDSTGWVVGREGTFHEKLLIKKTTNSGVTWDTSSIVNNPIQDYVLPEVFFDSETEGWIAVHNRIIHTTDGGVSWEVQYSDTSHFLYSIYFIDSLKGWAGGSNGTILYTADGGENWTPQVTNETEPFVDLYFTSETHGWAISFHDVYHTTTGGNTFVSLNDEESMPGKFKLMQNYPNPFNPSTKIKFIIPEVETRHASSLHTTLKVYDILGNEVATFVDEYKPAGNYEVELNANELSSGVYFYTLTAGNFKQTKKMILFK